MSNKTYFKMTKDAVTGAPEIVKQHLGVAKSMTDTAVIETKSRADDFMHKLEEKTIDIKKFGSSIPKSLVNPLNKAKSAMEKKITGSTKELEDALPVITKAGFELCSVDVEVGAMPKIIPRFKVVRHLTDDERTKVEQEASHSRMTKSILTALLQTQLISNIRIGGLELTIIELHMGAIPKARIRFSN